MIIKSTIISSGTKSFINITRYLIDETGDNEEVEIVSGSRQEVAFAFDDADRFNRKNAVAHFIFSSKEALTPDQMRDAVSMMKAEFGFSSDDIRLTVRHQKQRHDDGTAWDQHFHMLVSMVNPENGKVMDVSHSYARIEKVCRTFEAKHGLDIVSGKHDRAVIAAVEDPEIRENYRPQGSVMASVRPLHSHPSQKRVASGRGSTWPKSSMPYAMHGRDVTDGRHSQPQSPKWEWSFVPVIKSRSP